MTRKDNKPILERNEGRAVAARRNAVKMIGMGRSKEDVLDMLIEKYGYAEDSAQNMWKTSCNYIKKQYTRYADRVAETNINRLNTLIEDAYDSNDRKSILQAIDMLNKMSSIYVDRKEVKTSNEPITVKFS